jgi:ferredoxin like protein
MNDRKQNDRKHEPLSPELTASLPAVNVDNLVVSIKYYVDEDFAHIQVREPEICTMCRHKPCLAFCPVHVFTQDGEGKIMVGYQACVECGSCRIGCPLHNIDWQLPRGGYGVAYKFG